MEFKEIVKMIVFITIGYFTSMIASVQLIKRMAKDLNKQYESNNNKLMEMIRNFYGIDKLKK
jgi:hypothetical protein